MSKFATLLQKGKRALQDLELLKVLQEEIRYELSNDLYKNEIGSLGDFVVDWNSSHSKDIIMRKKCESGEEIAISALLGEETFVEDNVYPKEANMKVCIKKNGLSSILKFDCKVLDEGQNKVDFHIQNAYLLKSPTDLGSSVYKGPVFSELDPALQQELKQYLISRGIRNSLTAYLLHQIHHKEQDQYVKWLQKLESMVALRLNPRILHVMESSFKLNLPLHVDGESSSLFILSFTSLITKLKTFVRGYKNAS